MNKKITTYKELMEEKAHLTALLEVQKQRVEDDFRELKEELKPITNITSTLAMFFTRKTGSLASNLGINLLVNGLVKKVLLSKSGWFTRFIIPLLLKNYASNLVNKPENLVTKLLSRLFSKNGKAGHEAGMEAV